LKHRTYKETIKLTVVCFTIIIIIIVVVVVVVAAAAAASSTINTAIMN